MCSPTITLSVRDAESVPLIFSKTGPKRRVAMKRGASIIST